LTTRKGGSCNVLQLEGDDQCCAITSVL